MNGAQLFQYHLKNAQGAATEIDRVAYRLHKLNGKLKRQERKRHPLLHGLRQTRTRLDQLVELLPPTPAYEAKRIELDHRRQGIRDINNFVRWDG